MVALKNELHFSPKYTFSKVDPNDKNVLVAAFKDRVEGFYLEPAQKLNKKEHAFAKGVLCVSTIDFLACVTISCNQGDGRFEKWVKENIIEFNISDTANPGKTLAYRFYDEFRNGLVHEGRIKNCGQFSEDSTKLLDMIRGVMLINPDLLLKEIKSWFEEYISKVEKETLGVEFEKLKRYYLVKFDREIDLCEKNH